MFAAVVPVTAVNAAKRTLLTLFVESPQMPEAVVTVGAVPTELELEQPCIWMYLNEPDEAMCTSIVTKRGPVIAVAPTRKPVTLMDVVVDVTPSTIPQA